MVHQRETEEPAETVIPIIEVWNKADQLEPARAQELRDIVQEDPAIVVLSALIGEGIEALENALGEVLTGGAQLRTFTLGASEGKRIAWLHAHGEVLKDEDAGEGERGPMRRLTVRLRPKELGQFETL